MKKFLSFSLVSVLPVLTLAQIDGSYVTGSLTSLQEIFNVLIGVLIGLAVVWFAWNVIKYTMSEDDKKAEAKQQMIWGVIGLTVITSVWGIVSLVTTFFGVEGGKAPNASDLLGY